MQNSDTATCGHTTTETEARMKLADDQVSSHVVDAGPRPLPGDRITPLSDWYRERVPGHRGPRSQQLKFRLMLADAVAIALGFALAFLIQAIVRPIPSEIMVQHAALAAASIPFFIAGAMASRLYRSRANERQRQEARNILTTVAWGIVGILTISFAIQFDVLSRLWVFLVAIFVAMMLMLERRIARNLFYRMRADGRLTRRIIIVGTDEHAMGLMRDYRDPTLGYTVVGFAGMDERATTEGPPLLGHVDDLPRLLDEHDAVGVIVSLSAVPTAAVNRMARQLPDMGYHMMVSTMLRDVDVQRLRPLQYDGRTLIYVERVVRDGWRAVAKRTFDVVMASILLILAAPILALAALWVKLDSRGPVLFKQTRVGLDGRQFEILKLRTMCVDAEAQLTELRAHNEADGPLFKMARDPRVTRPGRVLRKLSIDELPQLFCVLRGTMSMVGPRPALPNEATEWDVETAERLRVLPGLTGMWQVSGRSDSSFERYKRLDLYYVDNWSLLHDLMICTKTVSVVLRARGAR